MGRATKRAQIRAMYELGIPVRVIARRLRVAEKTVRRNIEGVTPVRDLSDILDTELEVEYWHALHEGCGRLQTVAFLFGVTRQAVWERLKEKRQHIMKQDVGCSGSWQFKIREDDEFDLCCVECPECGKVMETESESVVVEIPYHKSNKRRKVDYGK